MVVNCTLSNGAYGACKTANTFENFFPTNHIHMGYMDVMGWKNMMSFSGNFQARLSPDDHIEIWYTNLHLANAKDNWYLASQASQCLLTSGQHRDPYRVTKWSFVWTHFFMNGMVAFQAGYGHLFPGSIHFAKISERMRSVKTGPMPSFGSTSDGVTRRPDAHRTLQHIGRETNGHANPWQDTRNPCRRAHSSHHVIH